jgi:3-oxoadipate enol-lactonase
VSKRYLETTGGTCFNMSKQKNMAYHESGVSSNPALVLLHSLWLNHHQFDSLISKYSQTFHIYAFDIYGHGDSPSNSPEIEDLGNIAAQVLEQLGAAGIESFHVLGQSMGADIGLRMAIQAPNRVMSMVLIGGSCAPANPSGLDGSFNWINELDMQGFTAEDLTRASTILLGQTTRTSPERNSQAAVVDQLLANLTREAIPTMRGVFARAGVCKELHSVHVPSLVISGDEDLARPVAQGRALSNSLSNSRFVEFDECGHTPIIEAFDRCITEIGSFWTQHQVVCHD